jgi:pro-kumamolisin-like protein/Big-like domain-containing protein
MHWGNVMRFISSKILGVALALIILMACSTNLPAQTAATVAPQTNVARVTQAVNESNRVTLKGNTHPLANGKNETGIAPDSLPMERMLMVLKRSPDQQAALKTFVEGQQSKTSPNFHQWLTPEQFGQQYGVSDSDIQTVTAWLQTHGFTVNRVAAGKMLIEFSGTAGQVHEAFQTQIHKYTVKGQDHWANASDPTIPAALMPVIAGVNTLNNFGKKALIQNRGVFSRSGSSAEIKPLLTLSGCTTINGASTPCLGVGPADFAAIYNVPSTIASAAAGAGQTIAIVGDSEICTGLPLPVGCTTDDVQNFRKIFNLPAMTPQIILDGPDPGLNGDEIEGDLDVEYSGAVAPNAQILFVIAHGTETSSGIDLAAERIIDYNLAPVMSESFGECETNLGSSGNQFFLDLWEQAAAQGITVIISTGDNGSAACDSADMFPNIAEKGLNVNGIASTPYNVAAGGTDFDFTAAGYPNAFWNSTSNSANGLSAKGYIPETTWNDTCAQSGITGCNGFTVVPPFSPLLQVVGGSGGQSSCVTDGCANAYAKPSWQSGSSVPNDMVRDVPDISLFASSGLLSNSFYVLCASDIGGTCTPGSGPGIPPGGFAFVGVGGTSAVAPTFAGIMALVNQNMLAGGHAGRQGDANFVLYPLSAAQTESSCNSSSIPGPNCVFNDVVKGNNSVPCDVASVGNCVSPNNGGIGVLESFTCILTTCTVTGQPGFAAGTGYDLATGLGSINVTNLLNGWPGVVGSFTPTSTSLTLGPLTACPGGTPVSITSCINIVHGATVNINVTVTGGTPINATKNTPNDVSLIGTCQTATPNCFLGGSNVAGVDRFDPVTQNVDFGQLANGTASGTTNELIGGTYNVTAHYAGDGVHGASDSLTPIQVKVSPEGSVTTGSVAQVNVFTGGLSAVSSAPYGSLLIVRTDIKGASSQLETATGQVTLNDSLTGATPVQLSLNSDGFVELQSPSANFPGSNPSVTTVPALVVGTHSFTSAYAGDTSYNSSSSSSATTLTITQGSTRTTMTQSPTQVPANTNFTLVAFVDSQGLGGAGSLGNAPTGNVTFFAGSTSLGSVPVVPMFDANGFVGAQATLTTANIATTSSITARYVGDTNYSTSTSLVITVIAVQSGFTLTPATNPLTVQAGNSVTSVITIAPQSPFTGTVALSCTVTPPGFASLPTCSFSPPSVTLGAAQTSTLTVSTTSSTTTNGTSLTYIVTVVGTSGTTVIDSNPIPLIVTAPPTPSFTLTPATSPLSIQASHNGTSVVSVTPTNGFTGSVALSCTVTSTPTNQVSVPTCGFSPSPVVLGATQTSTLTVTTTGATTVGPYILALTGTSGSTVVAANLAVNVTAGPSFTVASASNPTVVAGNSGTSVITVAPTNGFLGTVALTCSVTPSNLTSTPTCSFSAPSIVLGATQTSTLTVATTATTSLSAYTVAVTGTSGATVATTPVTVTVTTPGAFSLASTAVTIATPGQSGTSTITATGTGGFTGSVALSCTVTASSAVDPPTCTVGGPINLTSTTSSGTATLTVSTTAASGIPFTPKNNLRPNTRWIVGTSAAATILLVLLMCVAPVRKRRPVVVLASFFIFVGLAVAGCGSSGGGTSNPGTTAGSYTVTVTGVSGNITTSTAVNVTVQ